jgi:hypothetical protein
MGLRIGFDMDGVLANLAAAVRDVEIRLFGIDAPAEAPATPSTGPENAAESPTSRESDADALPQSAAVAAAEEGRRRRTTWESISSTTDFWMTLEPIDQHAVRQIHELMLRHRWEVVFITQRPATRGESVQRQTQRWLSRHGFDTPTVLVIEGSRGAAASVLRLDFHVDDNTQNCLDVMSESRAKPILMRRADDRVSRRARTLGIEVAYSIGECLDLLHDASIRSGRGAQTGSVPEGLDPELRVPGSQRLTP